VNDTSLRPTPFVPGVLALVHGAAWVALVLVLLLVVPRYDKMFKDFGLKLPLLTEMVVAASRWVVRYWYVLVPAGVVLLALDAAVLHGLRLAPATRILSWLWFLLILAGTLVALLVVWLAVAHPMAKLHEGLTR
jgi:hypothetical protein